MTRLHQKEIERQVAVSQLRAVRRRQEAATRKRRHFWIDAFIALGVTGVMVLMFLNVLHHI